MISVCVSSINARWDTEILVRSLCLHNEGTNFEVVIGHDDRVDDGSGEAFAGLSREFPNVKVATVTSDDTVRYLERVIRHYETNSLFTPGFRMGLWENFQKYKDLGFFDRKGAMLWLTPGRLYNKAVESAMGDVIVVTAGDFLYLFSLGELEGYVRSRARDGHFYAKPNAVWARASNQDRTWLENHVKTNVSGDSVEIFRDYTRQPHALQDLCIPDFKRRELICLADRQCLPRLSRCAVESIEDGRQHLRAFHGFHVMTRKTFNAVGGFTEEFFGRALAEDKMTSLGGRYSSDICMPPQFSVAWCGQYEIEQTRGQGYARDWQVQLAKIDPYFGKHPLPGMDLPVYMHDGILTNSQMSELAAVTFNKFAPPVRF